MTNTWPLYGEASSVSYFFILSIVYEPKYIFVIYLIYKKIGREKLLL